MSDLTIPLASIPPMGLEIAGDIAVADVQPVAPSDAEQAGLGAVPVDSLHVEGDLEPMGAADGSEFVFEGVVSGTYAHECDRCLDAVTAPFSLDVELYFRQTLVKEGEADEDSDEEPEAVYPIEGNEIDLGPAIWEEVALAAPTKFLCKEDCAGLCPVCGVNRNREACSCREQADDEDVSGNKPLENKGLAGLADLLPKLKPKHSEE